MILFSSLNASIILAQSDDPYLPEGVPESIEFPYLTVGIILVVIIGFFLSRYTDIFDVPFLRTF
jgi:hypothetical protein